MSETLFKFLLSKISTIRIHCRNPECGGIVEIPISKLGSTTYRVCTCPLCRKPFDDGSFLIDNMGPVSGRDLFAILAGILIRLNAIKDKVDIEFVLPDPDEEKTR